MSQLEGTVNGNASPSERETDILEDECGGDSQTSPAAELPSLSSTYSLSSANMPETQTDYSTCSWVWQQQTVDVIPSAYLEVDGGQRVGGAREKMSPPLVAAETPSRGTSRRGPADENGTQTRDNQSVKSVSNTHSSFCQNEDLASLTTDIDESIEQLNQLILDLDPTFVPVPTRCSPLSRTASLQTNRNTHLSGNTHTQRSTTHVTVYSQSLIKRLINVSRVMTITRTTNHQLSSDTCCRTLLQQHVFCIAPTKNTSLLSKLTLIQ